MIIVTLMGGMGNQMFQYAFGKSLALEHNLPLKVDLSFLQNSSARNIQRRNYSLDNFLLNIEYAVAEDINLFNTRLGQFANKVHMFLVLKGVKPVSRLRAWGYFQGEKYFGRYRDVIKSDFKFQPLVDKNEMKYEKMIKDCKNAVAVHVRRGDYVGNIIHDVCSEDYYQRAIKLMNEKVSDPTYFLFSDDQETRQNAFVESLVPIEGIARDGSAMHLMSLCKHFIISNSTFSWWAAWLGIHKEKIVMVPYKWFNDPKMNNVYLKNKILLADWERIYF